jgi:hypothetical protein
MYVYDFTVHLDRAPVSDEDFDRLYEAGLDDTSPVTSPDGRGELMVSRHAASMSDAILSVIADINKAGFRATGIDAEDLVSQTVIGQRVGRTRASISLLVSGKRGPGGFPAPVTSGATPLYSWAGVRDWFLANYGPDSAEPADCDADTLAAADLLLRARILAPNFADLAPLVTA